MPSDLARAAPASANPRGKKCSAEGYHKKQHGGVSSGIKASRPSGLKEESA